MQIKEKLLKVYRVDGRVEEIPQYIIYPDAHKRLRNKLTGLVIKPFVVVSSKREVTNYEDF